MDPSFQQKRNEWAKCLIGEDRNSVFKQIPRMVLDAAVYRIINDARRDAPPAPEGGVQLNGLVHRFIDRCFFETQSIAIRRLTDKCGLAGPKGTYSLTSLIRDMKQHHHLLTRENLFAAAGVPMDLEPVRRQRDEYVAREFSQGKECVTIPPELDYEQMESRHEDIDRLCEVRAGARTPSDTVQVTWFCEMLKRLDACEQIATYVNKFVAHAATPESRAPVGADDAKITLSHLWQAHEVICRTANLVDRYFLTGSCHLFVSMTPFDKFQYIDRPLVSANSRDRLNEMWEQFDNETQTWGDGNLDWLAGQGQAT